MFSLNSFSATVSGYFQLWIIKTNQKSINLAFQFGSRRSKKLLPCMKTKSATFAFSILGQKKKRFINNIPWFRFNSIFWTTTFETKLHPVMFVFWGRVRSCWKWNSNRPFYSYELSTLASEWKWGWRLTLFWYKPLSFASEFRAK